MTEFFNSIFYIPLYNALIAIVGIVPGHDAGVAVIILTFLVKIALTPLSIQAIKTQVGMKAIEPELKDLRETYKDDREKQAREMLELYKKHNIKPFSSILMALIQIPFLLYLFFVFQGEAFPAINTGLLYSFVHAPATVSILFLGLLDITKASIVLAVLAGIAQFVQSIIAIPIPKKDEQGSTPSFGAEFGRSMAINARYILPVIIGFFSYTLGGAMALYFIVSALTQAAQEVLFMKKVRNASVK
jgi:YidC/Oxa1 family membrane protein insertase